MAFAAFMATIVSPQVSSILTHIIFEILDLLIILLRFTIIVLSEFPFPSPSQLIELSAVLAQIAPFTLNITAVVIICSRYSDRMKQRTRQ